MPEIETQQQPEIETVGKWMNAVKRPRLAGRKTDRWQIYNTSGIRLGLIEWESHWRQYVFAPAFTTMYAESCLSDLATFVGKLNAAQRARKE